MAPPQDDRRVAAAVDECSRVTPAWRISCRDRSSAKVGFQSVHRDVLRSVANLQLKHLRAALEEPTAARPRPCGYTRSRR
jgi:hypothetical protein